MKNKKGKYLLDVSIAENPRIFYEGFVRPSDEYIRKKMNDSTDSYNEILAKAIEKLREPFVKKFWSEVDAYEKGKKAETYAIISNQARFCCGGVNNSWQLLEAAAWLPGIKLICGTHCNQSAGQIKIDKFGYDEEVISSRTVEFAHFEHLKIKPETTLRELLRRKANVESKYLKQSVKERIGYLENLFE